jgi:hypothetical protein
VIPDPDAVELAEASDPDPYSGSGLDIKLLSFAFQKFKCFTQVPVVNKGAFRDLFSIIYISNQTEPYQTRPDQTRPNQTTAVNYVGQNQTNYRTQKTFL